MERDEYLRALQLVDPRVEHPEAILYSTVITVICYRGVATVSFDEALLSGPCVLTEDQSDRIQRAIDQGFDPDDDDPDDYGIGDLLYPALEMFQSECEVDKPYYDLSVSESSKWRWAFEEFWEFGEKRFVAGLKNAVAELADRMCDLPVEFERWGRMSDQELEDWYEALVGGNREDVETRDADYWNSKACDLSRRGHDEDAIGCFDKALAIDPWSVDIWYNKVSSLVALGRHDVAICCYDQALRIEPGYAEGWCSMGDSLEKLGRYEESIRCCDNALAIDPELISAYQCKGLNLRKMAKYQDSLLCYNLVIQHSPEDPDGWFEKATAHGLLGQREEAEQAFRKFLELS